LGASGSDKYGDNLQKAVGEAILDDLIPKYIVKNRQQLKVDAAGEKIQPAVSTLGGSGTKDGLSDLYSKAGIKDYDWHSFGPERDQITWEYFSFDPVEKQNWESAEARFRKITIPVGMDKWMTKEFNAKKVGWKEGRAPFSSMAGKLAPQSAECKMSFCRCSDHPNTFWEKEALLLRALIKVPEIKEGYRYRLLMGGCSHVGAGDGYEIYFNGKKLFEANQGTGRRAGGSPKGYLLPKAMMKELSGKELLVGVKTFMAKHPRSGEKRGYLTLFIEEMKLPPLEGEKLRAVMQRIPMFSAEWQSLQDPQSENDPDDGKFIYDGKFNPNPQVVGDWKVAGCFADADDLASMKPLGKKASQLFNAISFKDDGKTDSAERIWSGDILMDLNSSQALRITARKMNGEDVLLIENGGFNVKGGADWKSPLLMLKRK
jgi:hypothetical protein